jgi:hypothetical protein
MPQSLTARFAIAFLLFVCGLAVWKGKTPERAVAIGAVVNEALYLIFYHPFDNTYAQWEAIIWDVIYLVPLGYAAIWANRTWAKWATAFELLIIGAHIAVVVDLRIATYFEQWGTAILTLAVLWALLIGTLQVMWQDRRARRAAVTASPPA